MGSYIINGGRADISDFPYQLSLRFYGSHTCGAVILSSTRGLTAAHCVDGRFGAFSVYAGSNNRLSGGQEVDVSTYTIHPDWQSSGPGFPNDIAVLAFSDSLTLGTNVAVANMPSGNSDFAGSQCVLSGWGRTGSSGSLPMYLMQVEMPIIDNNFCKVRMSPVQGADIADYHICAFDNYSGSCNGDSGGPMTCNEGGQRVVAGVTSWGVSSRGNCMQSYPSVYARTSYFSDFISTNM